MHYVKFKAISYQYKMLCFKFESNEENDNNFKKYFLIKYFKKTLCFLVFKKTLYFVLFLS